MERTYTTTDEMDMALAFEAQRQGKTADELFNLIVTADMGTLVRNTAEVEKEAIYAQFKDQYAAERAAKAEADLTKKMIFEEAKTAEPATVEEVK